MFHSIDEIRQANAARGHHFFDRDTLRFFGSRIHETIYPVPGGAYFVTSEKNFDGTERHYTVRQAYSGCGRRGEVVTVDGFQGYASRSGAHGAAQRLANAENE